MKYPSLTVAMPVYNGQKYLKEAIDSVLFQTYTDFELLIIDDGSKDQSTSIIKEYKDARIRLISNEENSGLSFTRNRALNEAKGDFLVWIDCDDLIDPQKFEIQIDYLKSNPEVGILGTWLTRFGEGRPRLSKSFTDREIIKALLAFYPSVWNATAMFRMELIRKAHLKYDERLSVAEDYNFYYDASFHFPMMNLNKSLYSYRASENSIMQKFNGLEDKMYEFFKIIYEKVFDKLGIEKTNHNLKLHRKFSSPILFSTWEEFQEANDWLLYLKKQNESLKIYDDQAFNVVLGHMLFLISKKSSKLGWRVFFKYLTLLKNFSTNNFDSKFRLFLRCMIKYDKY